jgi:hypothetical protein
VAAGLLGRAQLLVEIEEAMSDKDRNNERFFPR